MKRFRPSRVTALALALVALLVTSVLLATSGLLWHTRQDALSESESEVARFVAGAEAALNRNLLGVDVLLANIDELLGLSGLMADWIDSPTANRLLHGAAQQNLSVRNVALIDAQGRILASSNALGTDLGLSLPAGFVEEVLGQPVSTLIVSPPVVSFTSSEQVLYMGRTIKLADGSRVLAVAEVPVPLLSSIMVQGADIKGLEVTLERTNGELLASSPPRDELLGRRLLPALEVQRETVRSLRMAARLTGQPAMVVTRPILYRDVLIVASIPLDAALTDWRTLRNFIVGAAAAFILMLLTAGGFAIGYLDRLTQARLAIARSKTTLDEALESMVSGFLLLNSEHQVVTWNRRFMELYPWTAAVMAPLVPFRKVLEAAAAHHLIGASAAELQEWIAHRLSLQLNAQGINEQQLPNGQIIQITEQRTPDGGLVIVYNDVTELRRATAEIEQLAFYDVLTTLPNRRLLMDRMQQAMTSSARSGYYGALLFLDLDHFKTLNDTLGHEIGDLLLRQVAQRLKSCVREEDTVARLGGDEFVVMLNDLSEHSQEAATLAQQIGEKILHRLNQPYQLATHSYRSTPSIGATLFNALQIAPADLLKQADIAMYEVKLRGRNALCFFDPQMQAAISARAQLEEDLHAALREGQFELHYQPQVKLDGPIVGAEVLIRWRHPRRGLVLPAEFIVAAEESELILPIGQWVLRHACQQLAAWRDVARCRDLHLCVNVSARQFHQHNFVEQVVAVVLETGIDPHLLKLELTESLVLDNVDETVAKMTELKALGLQFSVDDFGTGHSSLTYLTTLPLTQLKIDQSFVRNIGAKPSVGMIVQTIIGMAHNLGLEVIAEGVETLEQQQFLALNGCTLYQGYLYGKPTPLAEFEALLGS